jgi:hypothetical protein
MIELIITGGKSERKKKNKKKHSKKHQVQEPQKVQSIDKSSGVIP